MAEQLPDEVFRRIKPGMPSTEDERRVRELLYGSHTRSGMVETSRVRRVRELMDWKDRRIGAD